MEIQSAPPFYYDYENREVSKACPSTVRCRNTRLNTYYTRYLLQKVLSVFEWDIPEEWDKDYFLYTLYTIGYIAVFDSGKYGVIPQNCGLRGYDIYYRPSGVIITNPFFDESIELEIGTECALIKLQPDYGSILDIVLYYANLMALASEAIEMNFTNSKLSYIFAGENKRQAESFKKMYDTIAQGEPAVFIDKDLIRDDGKPAWQMFTQNVGQNYIGDKILADLQAIESKFATEIGIMNTKFEKNERLLKDEINSNNVETAVRCELWLETIQKGFDKANELFDLNLKVDWRHDPLTREGEEVNVNESVPKFDRTIQLR